MLTRVFRSNIAFFTILPNSHQYNYYPGGALCLLGYGVNTDQCWTVNGFVKTMIDKYGVNTDQCWTGKRMTDATALSKILFQKDVYNLLSEGTSGQINYGLFLS